MHCDVETSLCKSALLLFFHTLKSRHFSPRAFAAQNSALQSVLFKASQGLGQPILLTWMSRGLSGLRIEQNKKQAQLAGHSPSPREVSPKDVSVQSALYFLIIIYSFQLYLSYLCSGHSAEATLLMFIPMATAETGRAALLRSLSIPTERRSELTRYIQAFTYLLSS